ncbi:phage minor head protein [Halalkalicoccus sp. NIPERK01]|uniref:phage head morphogenesis protein n=1 Tax=Halalkalicoccus sp. NIPERK01 TaxID=3053469 RepID=UPI00256EAECE|nr:phage minor head protein [Halalkalicoccus sp. NIPERK01]MDL5361360.1 phage minor head protein [Halalkalicoccus sp. NIPERK01]
MSVHAGHGQDCDHAACQPRFGAREEQRRTDPTRTKTPRKRFAQHLRGRFDAIKYHVNRGIVDNDALGLGGPDISNLEAGDDTDEFGVQVDTNDDLTPGTGQFDFPSNADAAAAFDDWLDEAFEGEILEKYNGDRYVRTGYRRGIDHADKQLRDYGATIPEDNAAQTLRIPIHEDKLSLMYERAFEELEGITQAAGQEIRRELTEGLAQGQGPRKIARNINDRVEKVGKTRATVMARTEVIRAHSESSLTEYERILGEDAAVSAKAEISTAGDNRVCDICLGLEGRVFSLQEARGVIPVHPQCRCAWVLAEETLQGSTNSARLQDKRVALACDECGIPLAEERPRCWHCDRAAAVDLPMTDLRDVAG